MDTDSGRRSAPDRNFVGQPGGGGGPPHGPDVASILDRAIRGAPLDRSVADIIGFLRRPDYGIVDLLKEIRCLKAVVGHAEQAILDEVMIGCVERTSQVHEAAIENMLHGFCELDDKGVIVYANPALVDLIGPCEGLELTPFFAIDSGWSGSIGTTDRYAARLTLLSKDNNPRPVRAEFGPLAGPVAASYAILTDLTEQERAERRAHDRTSLAIIKLDNTRHITYANAAAYRLLRAPPGSLDRFDTATLVRDPEERRLMETEQVRRRGGEGGEYELTIQPLEGAHPVHVRARSIPIMDAARGFVGSLVTMSSIDAEVLTQRIQQAIGEETAPRAMFARVAALLRQFVPLDVAVLSVFTQRREYSRILMAEPTYAANVRWIPIPEGLREIVDRPDSFGSNVSADILKAEGGQKLHDGVPVQELLGKGVQSWLSMPIADPDRDRVLTLFHSGRDSYNAETLALLHRTGVDHAMRAILRLEDAIEAEFLYNLMKAISQAANEREMATVLVGELARFYNWQNVSIFKVNMLRREFELLEQAVAETDGFWLKEGYRQPLDDGVLGDLLRLEKDYDIVGDANERPGFQRASKDTCSELCVPIHLHGQTVWILNLEDRRPNTFQAPDAEIVKNLIGELETAMDKAFAAALLDQVLDTVPDGVVVTDIAGKIFKCNANARDMLGDAAQGQPLARYFASSPEAAEAVTQVSAAGVRGTLQGESGSVNVLVSTETLREEYDHRVVLLKDRDAIDWEFDSQKLTDALADVATQVRVPLALASTFVREIEREAADQPALAEMAAKAARYIGRVELTYDRVLSAVDTTRRNEPVRLGELIEACLRELPAKQRERVEWIADADLPALKIDAAQIIFAVQSMFAYMLRRGERGDRGSDDDGRIRLWLRRRGNRASIMMARPIDRSTLASSGLDKMIEVMRARFALGEKAIREIARQHQGEFNRTLLDEAELLILRLRVEVVS